MMHPNDHRVSRRDALSFIRKIGLVAAAQMVPWDVFDKIGAGAEWIREAAAGTLPTNYQVVAGTQIADTSTGTAGLAVNGVESGSATWSVSEVTTPAFLRPRFPSAPSKVLKLQATSTAGGSYRFEWVVSVKPKDVSHFWFLVYAENLGGVTNNASILFSDTGSYTNRYSAVYSFTGNDEGRWRDVMIPFSSLSVAAGSPDPSVSFARFRTVFGAAVGATPTYYVCPIWINRASKPVFTVSFDDKAPEDFTNAYAYMQPRALPGSLAITSGSGALSVANMQTMQENGWSIHNHTHSHLSLDSLTAAQIRAELEACNAYLLTNGLTSGKSAMVYPYGATNAAVSAVVGEYFPYAFTTGGQTATNPLFDGIQNPYSITRAVMDVPSTANGLLAGIAAAVNSRVGMNLFGHVAEAGAASGHTDLTTFKTVMDQFVRLRDANVIQVRNIEDMLAGLVSPRMRRL